MGESSIKMGLMGLGTIGCGVVTILRQKSAEIAQHVGRSVEVKRILVRDLARPRPVQVDHSILTTNPDDILEDPEISIVVEVMGGEEPAHQYLDRALRRGKNVVTANKEVMARYGPELLMLAHERSVDIFYEASVGGGIPLIALFKHDLCANRITLVQGIVNGTTNFILTKMAREGTEFGAALKQAQALGYAEPEPANDVEGRDAACKLAILATLAFHAEVRPEDVYCEGITHLTARDFLFARELGYTIKLLAIGRDTADGVEVRVHPALLPQDMPLARVDGVYNAVYVDGDLVGNVLFYGRGAGALPTGSAIVADLIDLAQNVHVGVNSRFKPYLVDGHRVRPMDDVETRYYLRAYVQDRVGALAQVTQTLSDNGISIASFIAKGFDPEARTGEVIVLTHPAREGAMQKAIREMASLAALKELGSMIRVEG